MANDIRFSIGYDIDKTSVSTLTRALSDIQAQANKASFSGKLSKELNEASIAAKKLENILTGSWNDKLGQLNLDKFKADVNKAYGSVANLKKALESGGPAGAAAYNKVASSVLSTNLQLKTANKLLDNMATTMSNTVKWGVTSSIFNNITGSIQKAYYFTKDLDRSLNDIRIVTDKSSESMEQFAKQANKAAKELRASTTDYTDASLIYYQQGLSDQEVKARTETTLKTANVTKQAADTVSEQLTAVWNGYKVQAEESELYIDKMAAVATGTASDLEELATGMSKVASAANSMGVDIDRLNAQIATIVSVTRQAPESVGTALKTIYARMGDLQISGEDEFGTSLGTVSSQMAQMGIQVTDQLGNLRQMGPVIEEVAAKWTTWTAAQKQAAAVAMAGKRQYNNLIALFDNWDMYSNALEMSANAAGTLQKQQEIYMDSTEAHLQTVRTEAEKTYDVLFDQDGVNTFADALSGTLGILNKFLDGLGGGGAALLALGAIGTRVFSGQLGKVVGKGLDNINAYRTNLEDIKTKQSVIDLHSAQGKGLNTRAIDLEVSYAKRIANIQKELTSEEYNELTQLQHKIGLREEELVILEKAKAIYETENLIEDENLAAFEERIALKREQSQKMGSGIVTASIELKNARDTSDIEQKRLSYLTALEAMQKASVQKSQEEKNIKQIIKDLDSIDLTDSEQQLVVERKITEALASQKALHREINGDIVSMQKATQWGSSGEDEYTEKAYDQRMDKGKLNESLITQEKQQAIGKTVEGLSTIVSLSMTIYGIGKTIFNESLDPAQKLEQILATVVFMLPTLIGGIGSIATMGPGVTIALNSMAAGLGGTAATATTATAAFKAFGAALLANPVFQIVAAIAIAIGVTVLAVKKFSAAYNKNATAAKEAAEQAKKLTERYQELKTAADEFKKSISEYTDAKKGLKDLEVGTDEYKKALDEANKKAKELIETHKLYGKFTYGENGLINIDQKTLDKALKTSTDKANDAQVNAYGAQIYANQASLLSQATDTRRAMGSGTWALDTEDLLSAAEAINSLGDASIMSEEAFKKVLGGMESLTPAITNNLDLLIGSDGVNEGLKKLAKSLAEAQEANEYYAKQIMGAELEKEFGDKFDKMATGESGKIDEGLRAELVNATVGIENKKDSNLSGQYEKELSKYNFSAIGKDEALFDALMTDKSFSKKFSKTSTDKDLALTYAELLGYGDRSGLSYDGSINKGSVTDVNGKKVLENVSDDVMRQEIAKQAVMDKVKREFLDKSQKGRKESIDNLEEIIQNAKDAGAKFGVDFSDGLLTSIANESQDKLDFSALMGQLSPDQFNAISSMSDTEILNMFGIKNDEQLKSLGFKSSKAFLNSFKAAFDEDNYDEEAYITALNKKFEEQAESLGLDIDEFKVYKEILSETYPELRNNLEGLNETAIANKRMEKGVKTLAKGWEGFNEIMADSSASAEDISSILPDVNSGIQDILNLSKEDFELLPADFAKRNWSLIQDVVNGVDGAIDKLRDKSGQEILVKATGVLNTSQLDADLLALNNKLAGFDQNKFSIGISLDKQMASNTYTDFKNMCQDIITQAGMTTQQAQAYFRSMGYNIEFSEQESVRKSHYKIPNIKLDTVTGMPLVDPAKPIIELEGEIRTPGTAIKMITPTGSYGGGVATKRTAPKSSTPSKKSDSGGGSKSKKETKKGGDEFDRYWTINKAIQASVNSLAKMDKLQSHLFGQELINSLKQSNILLNQQAKLYDQLYAMQRQEAAELQATLRGNNVSFDANGAISNYAQATANALAAYNQAVAKYNKGALTDEAFAISEQAYEDFKKNLDRYDKLYFSEMQETKDKLDDIREKELENNLKAWETDLTIKLDLASARRDWNTFLKETSTNFKAVYSDLGKELSEILSNSKTYTGAGGSLTSDIQAIKEVKNEIAKMSSGGSSSIFASISEAQEKLKELNKTLMSDGKDLFNLYEDAWKTFMDGIEQSADKFEEIIGKFDRINKELEFQGQLIEMIYGEEAYELMSKLYEGQAKSTLSQIDSLKQQQDLWFDLYKNAQEGSEEQKKYYDNWIAAQDNLNGKVVDYIELLKNDYLNTINDVLKKLEMSIASTSLDNVGTQWDRITEKTDKYLDSVEKLYQTQTLANKINSSIKEATRLEDQQKLQDLYDREIEALREKDKLTQYDLDAANARYDIALKEIALEDARNSKSTMKLTRGNDGNWSYQYVADENDIASKQQELADAYDKLYDLGKDAYQSNLEALQSLQKNYLDSYKEILTNETLSQAEKEQQVAELQAYYFEQYKALAEENTQYRNDLATISSEILLNLYEQDVTNYQSMTDTEKALVDSLKEHTVNSYANLQDLISSNYDGIKDKAHTTMASTLEEWTSAAQALGDAWNKDDGSSVKVQISKANDQIAAATANYSKLVTEMANRVAKDFGPAGIQGAIIKVEDETEKLSGLTKDVVSEVVNNLSAYKNAVNQIADIWNSVEQSILNAISATQTFVSIAGGASSGGSTGASASKPGNGSATKVGDGILANGDSATLKAGSKYYDDSNGMKVSGSKYAGVQGGVVVDKINGNSYGVHIKSADGRYTDLGWVRPSDLSGYATGGYTGDWSTGEGKLALLHSKELVLNSSDTENILSAVSTIREIAGISDSINQTIISSIGQALLKMAGLNPNTNYSTQESNNIGSDTYIINAEFPSANDVNSIKEAILSLPNLASQAANKNKK